MLLIILLPIMFFYTNSLLVSVSPTGLILLSGGEDVGSISDNCALHQDHEITSSKRDTVVIWL